MIEELRTRLGLELDRLSDELTARLPMNPVASPEPPGDGATREVQRILQRRIRFLGQLLAGLACIDPNAIPIDRAGYGSVVRVRDLATGNEEVYTLMTGDFIDLDEGQVSLASPIGYALLGSRTGDHVVVTTPRGQRRYEVVDLTTLPAKLGIAPTGTDATTLQIVA